MIHWLKLSFFPSSMKKFLRRFFFLGNEMFSNKNTNSESSSKKKITIRLMNENVRSKKAQ